MRPLPSRRKHDRSGIVHLIETGVDRWPACVGPLRNYATPLDYLLEIQYELFDTEDELTCIRCLGIR